MSYGLDSEYQYTELLLDASVATQSGNGSSTPNNWPVFYFTTKTYNVAGVKVLRATIPNMHDNISPTANTFIYNNGVNNTITIAAGHPTGAQLATQLQTAISAISAGFTVTWANDLRQFTFTQNLAIAWSLRFPTTLSLYSIVGFAKDTTYSASGIGSTIVSPLKAMIDGALYYNLNSRVIGPYVECNASDTSGAGGINPTVCKIPIDQPKNSTIVFKDPSPTMWFDLVTPEISYLDFYLTLGADQNLIPVDMKGAPWSFTLGLLVKRTK